MAAARGSQPSVSRLEGAQMLRTLPGPRKLVLLVAMAAALSWTVVLWKAATFDEDLPVTGLLGGVALVLIGVPLGAALWISAAPRRATRAPLTAAARTDTAASSFVLSVMLMGIGAAAGIGAASGDVWGWPILVGGCVGGGLHLGLSFMMLAEVASKSSAPTAST